MRHVGADEHPARVALAHHSHAHHEHGVSTFRHEETSCMNCELFVSNYEVIDGLVLFFFNSNRVFVIHV